MLQRNDDPGPAAWVGTYVWTLNDPNFGGFSGFDLAEDGLTFRAITDRGYTVHGRLRRDAAGRVTGVAATPIETLRGDDGVSLISNVRDSEGMALAPDGGFYVSFERTGEVSYYADEYAPSLLLTYLYPNVIRRLPVNEGLEALANAPDGRLLAIPEYVPFLGGPTPVYVFDGAAWSQPFSIPHDGNRFRVTEADFGPDGKLYVLERDYWAGLGFRSRCRRFALTAAGLGPAELVFESQTGRFDNLEGLGVWRDGQGATRLTMISDDNFLPFQRTEIVEFRLAE